MTRLYLYAQRRGRRLRSLFAAQLGLSFFLVSCDPMVEDEPSPSASPASSPTPLTTPTVATRTLSAESTPPEPSPTPTLPCDEGSQTNLHEYFPDQDGDGYGALTEVLEACERPEGYADNYDDCDDSDPAVNPSAEDICGDEGDQDCDGWAKTCATYDVLTYEDLDAYGIMEDFDSARSPSACIIDLNGDGRKDFVMRVLDGLMSGEYIYGSDYQVRIYLSPLHTPFDLDEPDIVIDADYPPERESVGHRLNCDADVSGDSVPDLVLSAPRGSSDPGAENLGAVYAFFAPMEIDRPHLSAREADLIIEGVERDSLFGIAVGVGGDVNGDGYDDLIVSDTSSGVKNTGRAYLFHGPLAGALIADDADVVFDGRGPGLLYGYQVAIDGDYNGDGLSDVVISQPGYGTETNCWVGRVFVYHAPIPRDLTSLDADVEIVSDIAFDKLGYGLATLRYEGKDYLALGAPSIPEICGIPENDIGEERGSIYLFKPEDEDHLSIKDSLWTVQGETPGDHFSGGGIDTYQALESADGLLLTSSGDTQTADGAGAAYLLSVFTSASTASALLKISATQNGYASGLSQLSQGFLPESSLEAVQILGFGRTSERPAHYLGGIYDISKYASQQLPSQVTP